MIPALRAVFFVVLASLPISVFGQTKPELAIGNEPYGDGSKIVDTIPSELPKVLDTVAEGPIKTTLCELVKNPESFNDRLVQVRSEYVSKFQWTGLVDEGCSARIPVNIHHILDDLKPGEGEFAFTTSSDDLTDPERLKWRPIERPYSIRLRQDQNYRKLQQYAAAKFRWNDGGICLDCPSYRITAIFTGRFEYFETQTVAIRANPTEKPFLLSTIDPNTPLLRLALQAVGDVGGTPIDTSVYSASKQRRISLEEAHDLVNTYLSGCDKKHCSLLNWMNPDFLEFYGFEALNDQRTGSANIGFFFIDPRTADVWNGVICEQFQSPSLRKLQQVIRHRIGLADEQYRTIRVEGPMCGPGMPRVPTPK